MIQCQYCGKSHKQYSGVAKCKWGNKAEWISGDGPFAVLAHCRVLTVVLKPTLQEVKDAKATIDAGGCGGACAKRHEIVNLDDEQ